MDTDGYDDQNLKVVKSWGVGSTDGPFPFLAQKGKVRTKQRSNMSSSNREITVSPPSFCPFLSSPSFLLLPLPLVYFPFPSTPSSRPLPYILKCLYSFHR